MLKKAVSVLQSALNGFYNEANVTTNSLVIGFVVCFAVYWWMTRRRYNLPPGPTGLPILGYLPFLGKELHKVFDSLSKRYGSVLGLYMGRTYVVVLGEYETVKEGLSQPALMGRPTAQFDYSPDGFGFATNNSTEWTEQRRYSVRAMRDIGLGGSKWETNIQEEVDEILKVIEERNGQPTDYWKILSESMTNNITTLVLGKRFKVGDPARQVVERVVETAVDISASSLRNFFPVLADFLAKFGIGSQDKDLHRKFAAFTDFMKEQVEARKKVYKNEDSEIFIDGYLKEIENNKNQKLNNTFNERNLRGTVLSLLTAGSDTTTATLQWLLIAMAEFPEVQAKVHQELDAVLGREGRAKYTERNRLPYTHAVTQEIGRWATIAPLDVVRQAMEDTKLNGYDIPKDTIILSNLWAIHRSPKYWKNPESFIPERFLASDGQQSVSKTDGYIPFSFGKRNCPGETVAKIAILLYFTAIMQKFKVLPPVGKTPKLEARPGITYRPVTQDLRLVLRD